ncbi:MAG: hypothetical protein ACFFG0_07155 [Candidatus Thorarchaeota archaeon]
MNDKKNPENKTKELLQNLFLTDFSTIQSQIGRYDHHSLLIKGWAITLWSGLMYFIIKESVYDLFLIQIIALLIFWSFDALYKFYQRRLALRSDELRKYLKIYKLNVIEGNIELIYKEDTNLDRTAGLDIINPRETFQDKLADKKLKLRRCILLRVVSVIYIYLISATFLISVYILETFDQISFSFILVLSLITLSFGIFNYILGIDKVIEEHKKGYLSYFYISIGSIFTNLILIALQISNY